MKINIIFLESEKELSEYQKKNLKNIISLHMKRAAKLFDLKLINVIIYFNKDWVIPETGEGANASGADLIQITIDPTRNNNKIDDMIKRIIPLTVYHELNHLARLKFIGHINKTLLDSIISEGLANVFAEEMWSEFKAPWGKHTYKEIKSFVEPLKKEKNKKKYSHDEWFFGSGEKPRWIGYKLGSYIIQSAKKVNPGLSAQDMTKLETKEVVKLSGLKI